MTFGQTIQWVVLPAGLSPDGAQARISVFVAPRLEVDDAGPQILGEFPDFDDWPARLAAAQFLLETTDPQGLPVEAPVPLTVAGPPADSALWQRFFPATTRVVSHRIDDYRGRTAVAYPARQIADSTRGAFAGAAADSPDELPTASRMSQFAGFAAAGTMADRLKGIAAALREADAADNPDGLSQPDLTPQDAFLAFHQQEQQLAFFAGPGLAPPPPPPIPPAPPRPEQPDIDFHQMLSALGDHPALLRRLGLVVDFTVPVGQLKPTRGELGLSLSIQLDPLLSPEVAANISPITLYALVPGEDFCAAADGSDPLGPPARGLIELPDEEYSLQQVDIDGVNLKLLAASVTAATPGDGSPDGPAPERNAPPSVRTAGLSLVRDGVVQSLQNDFRRAGEHDAALLGGDGPVVLTAEDLVRGHRIDVFDDSRQRWFSLHQRTVRYNPPDGDGEPIATVTDEGFFQASLTEPDGPASRDGQAPRVHVHEYLVSWDGWALSAPRPGKALVDERQIEEGPEPEPPGPRRIANRATTTLPLQIEAEAVRGTLPRLRFGRSYRVRVRTVDLAGNGPTLQEAERLLDQDVLVLPPAGGELFRRYEPVPAPALMPRSAFTHGDSLHRMVIRSTAELTPQEYADLFNFSPPVIAGDHRPYRPEDDRHLVAPKASLECVERHGKLDDAIASQDPQVRRAFYELAVRESGTLDDPSLPGVTLVPLRDDGSSQSYVVHTGEGIDIPYLPDPLSLGVVFHDLPGMAPGEPFEVPWAGTAWHAPQSLRLRIVEGSGPPVLDPAARVLTVELPKAAVHLVRVSSKAAVAEKIMGMLKWCRDALDDDERFENVMGAARANRHWMLTPWHELTLVHAVQRPLTAPALTLFDINSRSIGDTGEHLAGLIELDAPSTERIDLFAHWNEEIDDLGEPGPRSSPREMTAPVFRLPLALAVEFAADVDIQNVPATLDGNALFFSTPAAAAAAHDFGRQPATPEMQEFGDTKHRLVHYEPVATTPFGDCFPPEFAEQPERELLSVRGAPVEHTVLSSAKPAAPKVLDCLPTLGFETSGGLPGTLVRRRVGGGLRIYLARPWYTSGNGELLAVLLNEEGEEPADQAHPFITLMGRDPIKLSAPVVIPTAQNFPGTDVVKSALVLPDPNAFFPGFTVTAAGYTPQFDPASGRWFCDLDIDTGDAYFPFVRLALARLQPHSLEGEHLSPIVHSAMLRTLPERVLTVEGSDPLTIQLAGPNYVSESIPAIVSATLQVRDPELADDAVAWSFLDDTEVALEPDDSFSHRPTYFGEMFMPSPLPEGQLRLVVVEFSQQHSDLADSETSGLGSRVVYSDVVPL
ncbi:hypothetical protein AB0M39_30130 [Streptomyces sp. NPDC051907]|uniref:hypothetical protein n=1 Tax=Streptomyces sp. NPDC051907 TaxID=3155284 RepID=UPI00344622C3